MPKLDKGQIPLEKVYARYRRNVKNPVDYKTHKLILDTWGLIVIEHLVQGESIEMYGRLSTLAVHKKEAKLHTDFLESKRQKKWVRVPNVHSDFYLAYVYWAKQMTKVRVKGWAFKPTATFKKALGKVMKTKRGHTNFMKKAWMTTAANKEFKTKLKIRQL